MKRINDHLKKPYFFYANGGCIILLARIDKNFVWCLVCIIYGAWFFLRSRPSASGLVSIDTHIIRCPFSSIVGALCLVVHRSRNHIIPLWGVCNPLEHQLAFDKKMFFILMAVVNHEIQLMRYMVTYRYIDVDTHR